LLSEGWRSLQGAAIVIKGTTVGTITDKKGLFKLGNVSDDALLVVSYVGFNRGIET